MSRNMMARRNKCGSCERPIPDAYLCRRCGNELRDLLIGSNDQPGIIWYLARLRESAYGQSKLARAGSSRSTREGYALLSNQRAVKLLSEISGTLAHWEAHCDALRATHSHELPLVATGTPERQSERLEARRARFIAAHVSLIRRHHANAARLHADMLRYAKQSWSIINRPNDICCGPCPHMIVNCAVENQYGEVIKKIENPCGTLLYAEEGSADVTCPNCRTRHNVDDLRTALRETVRDMLFSGPELLRLMETRLNDRMSKSTFYQLIRDGRLQARHVKDDVPQYTYDDLCEAREKPKPTRKSNVKAS
jgi:hypothetical protein